MQTSYEDFLEGDQEDRDIDVEDECTEAEDAAWAEARRTRRERSDLPHFGKR